MKDKILKLKSKFGSAIRKSYELPLWKWLIVCFVLSVIEVVLLEMLGRRSILTPFVFIFHNPLIFVYNILIIYFTLSISLMFKRRGFAMGLIMILWLAVGTINFVLLGYRITPFSAIDFLMFSDVLSMFNIYFNLFQRIAIVVSIIVFIIIIVLAFLKTPIIKGKVNYIQGSIVVLISFTIVYIMTFIALETSLISDKFTNLGTAYKSYGFVYCFANSVIDQGISKPDDYSYNIIHNMAESALATSDDVNKIKWRYKNNKKQYPDIIVIQLESFIDIGRVKGVHTSRESIPNFKKFEEEYPSGFLTVPAIGAGTANTEFEILTGMKSKIFGAGEYPYKTVLTHTPCESMAQILLRNGYGTHAIHNNKAKFYSRDQSYANLGFQTFTSLEYMKHFHRTLTGWAKDDCLPEEITNALDYDEESDFVFTISVQGHGRYPKSELKSIEHVKVTLDSEDPELTNQFGYFVNQCYEMDQMIGELKETLDNREKDYVLVLYGDHIPSLTFEDDQFQTGLQNQTEYVIISNFDTGLEDRDIYSYELSDYLLRALGFRPGIVQGVHKAYFDENLISYENLPGDKTDTSENVKDKDIDKDKASSDKDQNKGGNNADESVDNAEASDENPNIELTLFDKYIHELQYDMLYGDRYIYNYIEPYETVNMRLGLYDISIDQIDYNSSTGSIVVRGENFTEFSKVLINDERMPTTYIDENTIMIIPEEVSDPPQTGDIFVVAQVDKDKHELSRSTEKKYSGE